MVCGRRQCASSELGSSAISSASIADAGGSRSVLTARDQREKLNDRSGRINTRTTDPEIDNTLAFGDPNFGGKTS